MKTSGVFCIIGYVSFFMSFLTCSIWDKFFLLALAMAEFTGSIFFQIVEWREDKRKKAKRRSKK